MVTACLGANLYTDVENSSFSVTAAIAGIIVNANQALANQAADAAAEFVVE